MITPGDGNAAFPAPPGHRRWLIAVAGLAEAEAVVRGLEAGTGDGVSERVTFTGPVDWRARPVGDRFDLVLTGVGKGNAAGALARVFVPPRHGGVLSLGLGGGFNGLGVGEVVIASESLYADEGAVREEGWQTAAEFGFPAGAAISKAATLAGAGMGVCCDAHVVDALRDVARAGGFAAHVGPVATVSTVSGVDSLASAVRERTGAIAEAMEGAAVGLTAKRLAPEAWFAECRVISNRVGSDAGWNLDVGLAGIEAVARGL
jgi:futalosine hydrolase